MEEGYDVNMSEIHGMSQRGGDVISQVRYSRDKVYSPVIEKGTADIVVAFEEMEALRNLVYLKRNGAVVVNRVRIPSMTILTGAEVYPDDIMEEISKATENVTALYATAMAESLGNAKAANVILLGALVRSMGLDDIDWEEIVAKNVKAKFKDLNIAAFKAGMEAARK